MCLVDHYLRVGMAATLLARRTVDEEIVIVIDRGKLRVMKGPVYTNQQGIFGVEPTAENWESLLQ